MSANDVNILSAELEPKSFGEYIDALIITNMRMWHAQEFFYELDLLSQLSKDEMFEKLRYGSWLNLQRNFQMDGLDASLAGKLQEIHPGILDSTKNISEHQMIWEQT